MCGIVGCVGYRNSVPMVLEGLARLEYRGYDSAGMAVIDEGRLRIHKVKGKINDLRATTPADFAGTVGIGHTRWATHGIPNAVNAHPHTDPSGRIAVVHNGIIDNAQVIKDSLLAQGYTLSLRHRQRGPRPPHRDSRTPRRWPRRCVKLWGQSRGPTASPSSTSRSPTR